MNFKQYIKIYTCLSKNHNNAHFAYQCLWVYMAHEEIIWETLKNYVTSSNNLQKNNFCDLTLNFGQLQKHVQHSRFCILDRYILPPHLLISWHTYGNHICLFHDTYRCNFWHELQTIHQNIYLFIKNHNNAHFAYQLLWV